MIRMLFIILVMITNTNLAAPLFVLYQQKFDISNGMVTMIFTIYACTLIFFLLYSNYFKEKFGSKNTLIMTITICILSTTLFLLPINVWIILLARAILGIAIGLFMGTGTAFMIQHTSIENKTRAVTLGSIVTMLGFGLGPIISGLQIQYLQWKPLACSFIILLFLLIISLFLLFTLNDNVETQKDAKFRIKLGVPTEASNTFWSFSAASVFVMFAINGTIISLIPTYIKTVVHSSNLALSGICLFIMFGGGAIIQRIPFPKKVVSRSQVGLLFLGAGSWGIVVSGLTNQIRWLWIGVVLQAIGSGYLFQSSIQITSMLSSPQTYNQLLSTYYVAAYGGMIIPTLLVGFLSNTFGLIHSIIVLVIVITILGMLIGFRAKAIQTKLAAYH